MANDLNLRVLFGMVENVTRPLRNILAANNETAASLKGTRDQLKALEKTQGDLAAFRKLRTDMKGTAGELDQARAKVSAMAKAMHENGPPTKAMVRDFNAAKKAAASLADQNQQQ